MLLEGGDVATAGLRLISASPLEADESVLTGESLPVAKSPEPMSRDAPLAERTSMVFKRTSVTRRSAETFVVATGMDSELGKISLLVEEAKEESTPLEERLDQLGRKLIWVVLLIAAVVTGGGVSGKEPLLMIQTSIVLSVATEAPQRFSLQIS